MTQAPFGHAAPVAGFEVPIEMLAACHGRVEQQCATLTRLVAHVAANGADTAARQAAAAVMRYFDLAAPHHHADEEADLFPALRAGGASADLQALMARLMGEHRELEARWGGLRLHLDALQHGALPPAPWVAEVSGFCALYADHIAREERELLPAARARLTAAELDGVGRAMRLRRGLRDD